MPDPPVFHVECIRSGEYAFWYTVRHPMQDTNTTTATLRAERWHYAEDGKTVRATIDGMDRVVAYLPVPSAEVDARATDAQLAERAQRCRVMAAAPELLGALNFVGKYIAMRESKGDEFPSQLVDAVRAALAETERAS